MRTSTLFTIASLFLVSSFSLPQPENLEASRSIEDREAKPPGPPPHSGGDAEWWKNYKDLSSSGGSTTSSNSTKIKEREAHREKPWEGQWPPGGSPPTSTNTTKLKERQHGAPGGPGDFTPPDGMTWMEFMKLMKHNGGSRVTQVSSPASTGGASSSSGQGSASGNSTKVKMVKFRD